MDKLHQCNYHKKNFMDAEQELQGILDAANSRAVPLLTLKELSKARELEYRIVFLRSKSEGFCNDGTNRCSD